MTTLGGLIHFPACRIGMEAVVSTKTSCVGIYFGNIQMSFTFCPTGNHTATLLYWSIEREISVDRQNKIPSNRHCVGGGDRP